jgi:hypothetical protein
MEGRSAARAPGRLTQATRFGRYLERVAWGRVPSPFGDSLLHSPKRLLETIGRLGELAFMYQKAAQLTMAGPSK